MIFVGSPFPQNLNFKMTTDLSTNFLPLQQKGFINSVTRTIIQRTVLVGEGRSPTPFWVEFCFSSHMELTYPLSERHLTPAKLTSCRSNYSYWAKLWENFIPRTIQWKNIGSLFLSFFQLVHDKSYAGSLFGLTRGVRKRFSAATNLRSNFF